MNKSNSCVLSAQHVYAVAGIRKVKRRYLVKIKVETFQLQNKRKWLYRPTAKAMANGTTCGGYGVHFVNGVHYRYGVDHGYGVECEFGVYHFYGVHNALT